MEKLYDLEKVFIECVEPTLEKLMALFNKYSLPVFFYSEVVNSAEARKPVFAATPRLQRHSSVYSGIAHMTSEFIQGGDLDTDEIQGVFMKTAQLVAIEEMLEINLSEVPENSEAHKALANFDMEKEYDEFFIPVLNTFSELLKIYKIPHIFYSEYKKSKDQTGTSWMFNYYDKEVSQVFITISQFFSRYLTKIRNENGTPLSEFMITTVNDYNKFIGKNSGGEVSVEDNLLSLVEKLLENKEQLETPEGCKVCEALQYCAKGKAIISAAENNN